MTAATFGVIGLGTMGRNLALNIESRGVPVAVWNLESEWVDDFIRDHKGHAFVGTKTFEELASSLERPRRILMMIPAGKPVESDDREDPAGPRSRRRAHRWRELLVRRHAPPRGSAAPGRHPLRRVRRVRRRRGRAIRPVDHAGRIGRRVGTDQGRARGDRGADRGGSVRHARWHRRRRALRQDGPQRDRVRRHATHRRGLGRDAPRARPERPGDCRHFRRMESRPAGILPRRIDGTGLSRDGPGNQAAARRRRARQGRSEGNGTLDDAGRAGPWRRGPDDRRRARRAWPLEPEGRTGTRVTIHRRPSALRGVHRDGPAAGDRRSRRRALRRAHLRVRPGDGPHQRRSGQVPTGRSTSRRSDGSGRGAASFARGCSIQCARPSKRSRVSSTCCSTRPSETTWSPRRPAGGAPSVERRQAASPCPLTRRRWLTSTAIALHVCRRV